MFPWMLMAVARKAPPGPSSPMNPRNARAVRWFLMAITVVALFVFLLLTVALTAEWMSTANSASWPTVEGRVVFSRVGETTHATKAGPRTEYFPNVEYWYEVDGVRHRGTRLSYRSAPEDRAGVQEIVDGLPLDSRVAVHYDPDNPARAVLEPGSDFGFAGGAAVCAACVGLCAVAIWVLRRGARRAHAAAGGTARVASLNPALDETIPSHFRS